MHFVTTTLVPTGLITGVGIVLGDAAEYAQFPLAYYIATFMGIGFLVLVIKTWTWFEDRQKKDHVELEKRVTNTISQAFEQHNAIEHERYAGIKAAYERLERRFDEAIEAVKRHG